MEAEVEAEDDDDDAFFLRLAVFFLGVFLLSESPLDEYNLGLLLVPVVVVAIVRIPLTWLP